MNVNITTPVVFGVGDGFTTSFTLAPTSGTSISSVVTATLHRTDWQGRQLLYATPRTNLLQQSSNFASWGNFGGAPTGSVTGPDGVSTAEVFVESTDNTNHFTDRADAVIVSGSTNTLSVLAAQAGRRYLQLGLDDGAGLNGIYVTFDLQAGVVTQALTFGTGVVVATSIEELPAAGWYQVSVSGSLAEVTVVRTFLLLSELPTAGVAPAYMGDGVSGVALFDAQLEPGSVATSRIPTTTAPVTVTDYVLNSNTAIVTLAQAPAPAAVLDWTGSYIYTPPPPPFPRNTILSQYAASPTLTALIENFGECIDPSADIDAFYSNIFNLSSAVGYGLDCWGAIVGVSRTLQISTGEWLGFEEAGDGSVETPFNTAQFYSGESATENYSLTDEAFRQLILAKAFANISDGSISSINTILMTLFGSSGDCWCTDGLNMTMTYTFGFGLSPVQYAIVSQSGALPRPAGVSLSIVQLTLIDNGGVLELSAGLTAGYPISSVGLADGALWSNDHVICVAGATTPDPSAPPVYFITATASSLLTLGGANLPLTNPGVGTGQLWNNGGVVSIA